MEVELTVFETGWGWIGLATSERGLAGLVLPQGSRGGALQMLRRDWPAGQEVSTDKLRPLVEQIQRYLSGEPIEFDIPLDWSGHTPFLQEVWQVTRSIPYGETRAYAELAQTVGRPQAYRAVGRAMATNPIPLIVPCHRVLRSDGGLGGYGGGLDMKRRLLDMEQAGKPAAG